MSSSTTTVAIPRAPVKTVMTRPLAARPGSELWSDWKHAQNLLGKLGMVSDGPAAQAKPLTRIRKRELPVVFASVDNAIKTLRVNPVRIAVFAAVLCNWRLVYYLVATRNVSVFTQIAVKDYFPEEECKKFAQHTQPLKTLVNRCMERGKGLSSQQPDGSGGGLLFCWRDFAMLAKLVERGADFSPALWELFFIPTADPDHRPAPRGVATVRGRSGRMDGRRLLIRSMIESGAQMPTSLQLACLKLGGRTSLPSEPDNELWTFGGSEFERLQFLMWQVRATIRGVLILPGLFDIIFSYLPWWRNVHLTANLQRALDFALQQRLRLAELECKLTATHSAAASAEAGKIRREKAEAERRERQEREAREEVERVEREKKMERELARKKGERTARRARAAQPQERDGGAGAQREGRERGARGARAEGAKGQTARSRREALPQLQENQTEGRFLSLAIQEAESQMQGLRGANVGLKCLALTHRLKR